MMVLVTIVVFESNSEILSRKYNFGNIFSREWILLKFEGFSGRNSSVQPNIYISIGLCYGHNPDVYNKQNYPYKEATIRAAKLWKHFLPQTKVLVTIVYSEPEPTTDLIKYKETLEEESVIVNLYHSGNVSCVTASQVIRLITVHVFDFIDEEDIVITG